MAGEMIRAKRLFEKNAVSGGTSVVPATSVSGDGLLGSVPAGWMLEMIVFKEFGGAAIDIQLGTSAGGTQISAIDSLGANAVTLVQYTYVSQTLAAFDVYISKVGGGVWGATELDCYLILRKVS